MNVEPYLFFNGCCEEALDFYREALGARVEMIMRFKESPDPIPADSLPPGSENKIMHASFLVGGSRVMASDGKCLAGQEFRSFALSLTASDATEANLLFGALSLGGKVVMPMVKTFWSSSFGMLTDRFGVLWMITIAESQI